LSEDIFITVNPLPVSDRPAGPGLPFFPPEDLTPDTAPSPLSVAMVVLSGAMTAAITATVVVFKIKAKRNEMFGDEFYSD
jgi:hypothetical protein